VQQRQHAEADDGVAGDEAQQPDHVPRFDIAADGHHPGQFPPEGAGRDQTGQHKQSDEGENHERDPPRGHLDSHVKHTEPRRGPPVDTTQAGPDTEPDEGHYDPGNRPLHIRFSPRVDRPQRTDRCRK